MITTMYDISLSWDDSAKVWIATSDTISGLVLESASLEELLTHVSKAVPELLSLQAY